jgi:hypothetical protein
LEQEEQLLQVVSRSNQDQSFNFFNNYISRRRWRWKKWSHSRSRESWRIRRWRNQLMLQDQQAGTGILHQLVHHKEIQVEQEILQDQLRRWRWWSFCCWRKWNFSSSWWSRRSRFCKFNISGSPVTYAGGGGGGVFCGGTAGSGGAGGGGAGANATGVGTAGTVNTGGGGGGGKLIL